MEGGRKEEKERKEKERKKVKLLSRVQHFFFLHLFLLVGG